MALRADAIPIIKRIVIPALDEIIKSSYGCKKIFKLIQSACKSAQKSLSKNITHPHTELILNPFILACKSHEKKFAVPALNCFQKLICCDLLTSEADPNICSSSSMVFKVMEAICTVRTFMDDAVELLMINALLCAVGSTSLKIQGDCLMLIAKTSYEIHMKRKNVVSQNAATEPLIEALLVMVYKRMKEDCSAVTVQPVFVSGSTDSKNTSQFIKGLIAKFSADGAWYKMILEQRKSSTLLELIDEVKSWDISVYQVVDDNSDHEVEIETIQKKCSLVYNAFCNLPMKMHPEDDTETMNELPKILLDNATMFPPTTDRIMSGLLRCFFAMLKFMVHWMNTELQSPDAHSADVLDGITSYDEGGNGTLDIANDVEAVEKMSIDSHSDSLNKDSKVATLELVQRRPIETPVILNIYNLTSANRLCYWAGIGAFHSGVEVNGVEYSFWGTGSSSPGVFTDEPRKCPNFKFKKSILIGTTVYSPLHLRSLIDDISCNYSGDSYNLFTRNCNHFSKDFCFRLTGNQFQDGSIDLLSLVHCCCVFKGR